MLKVCDAALIYHKFIKDYQITSEFICAWYATQFITCAWYVGETN